MKKQTQALIDLIASQKEFLAAQNYYVREDCSIIAQAQQNPFVNFVPKKDRAGVDVYLKPQAQAAVIYLPVCLTQAGLDDVVYTDFHLSAGATATIIAGCGIDNSHSELARHHGVHRFFVEQNAQITYIEKHIGWGDITGQRAINTDTEVQLAVGSQLTIKTTQIGGLVQAERQLTGKLAAKSKLLVFENLLTENSEQLTTNFDLVLAGKDSQLSLISRSVAKDNSQQHYSSIITGETACFGHSACDAILVGHGQVTAQPSLQAHHPAAQLIHEAAIGKIADEQLLKLQTLGLTRAQAEKIILRGFLQQNSAD